MNLIKVHPRRNLFHTDPDPFRVFDNFFAAQTGCRTLPNETITPTVDIYDKDNKVVIEAELPGFDKKDINVDVKGRELTLSAEHKKEEEIKEEEVVRRERYYGKFKRRFNLAFDINTETISASYKNGVLILEVPKPKEREAKQIAIH